MLPLLFSRSVVADSLQPHGLQPARLLCPWSSPGKNTGVGCHSLLQRIFLTQGLNLGLLHCSQILYSLSHLGSLEDLILYLNIIITAHSCLIGSLPFPILLMRKVRPSSQGFPDFWTSSASLKKIKCVCRWAIGIRCKVPNFQFHRRYGPFLELLQSTIPIL